MVCQELNNKWMLAGSNTTSVNNDNDDDDDDNYIIFHIFLHSHFTILITTS